ncbi:MAG: DUF1028 domain-containing protein [Candidatus Eisenbacteria bacterium]|uniref:DUF1028 domain-containing protein n=1 Tax=Eiseniibacteriota bacterium TaxID=2212470 RepID=A0A956SDB2_UNCEI|nr:DUF1028 domain-containing protein [Candidatus Eisenbacteria bacterium]
MRHKLTHRIHTSLSTLTFLSTLLFFLTFLPAVASATFSICAVDPGTGEVGSAGASCIAGAIILSDVHPGVGVVHTQAYWNAQNQAYARQLMDEGFSPQEIVDMVVSNDAQGNPTIRQYGVVDLVDGGRSAGYTGVNTTDWKGHITGPVYAIQGNILLGPEIVEDMETAFLATEGSLADRLMAALQAAKRPRADTRCTTKSAISAFLRVGRSIDSADDLFLDLNVNNTSGSTDPIDVLQGLYDEFLTTAAIDNSDGNIDGNIDGNVDGNGNGNTDGNGNGAHALTGREVLAVSPSGLIQLDAVRPNPSAGPTEVVFTLSQAAEVRTSVYGADGRELEPSKTGWFQAGTHRITQDLGTHRGVVFLRIESGAESVAAKLGVVR